MKRILLTVSFDGTNYHGWQVQPNGITVQEKIQDALEKLLLKRPNLTGCSRTDSGVHANRFCCHFDMQKEIDVCRLPNAINSCLPSDIVVISAKEVEGDFHARYNCKGKNYIYKIVPNVKRHPFLNKYALLYPKEIDIELLNKACAHFIGQHDFSSFCASGSSVENKVRNVSKAEVYKENDSVIFSVSADGFLYNMVRIMAGVLLAVNEGKLSPNDIESILNSKDRTCAPYTAPAQGLYLNEIYY